MSSRANLYELSKNSANVISQYKQIIDECREKKTKFSDTEFYPQIEVQKQDKNILKNVNWRRAEEEWGHNIMKNVNEFDICQGELSDCFLISAFCQIAKNKNKVNQLFVEPVDVSTGCVCVKFQIFERPVYVIVDTYVPFVEDSPRFSHPREKGKSYWFALVEKAYCKFLGNCHAIKGGASITAMYHMFGYTGYTKKVAELGAKMPADVILEYLEKTPFVFASIDRCDEAVEAGLTDDHTYAVYGVDVLGGKKIIHLRNPHGKSDWQGDFSPDSPCWEIGYKKQVGFKEGGHLWINESDFGAFFSSISASIPLQRGWTMQTVEIDVEKGSVNDGRTPFGNGPFVGNLKQWLVNFQKPCVVKLLFEEIAGSNHAHIAFMQQNESMKVSQAVGESYFALKTSDETINSDWEIKDVSKPYTLVVSREHYTEKNDAHYYLRMESSESFTVCDLPEPDFEHMYSEKIEGTLKSGQEDDRYPGRGKTVGSVRQWNLKLKTPGKVFFRVTKDKSETKNTLFLGHAMKDGKLSRKLKDFFALTKKIHQNSRLEEWYWKVTDIRRPIVFGMCRDKATKSNDFTIEVYSKTEFEVTPITEPEDLEEPKTAKIKGSLVPGWTDDRSPYGSIEGLSPLQQFRVDVKEPGRIYLIFTHTGTARHMIAVQKTHRIIDHFGIGDDDYFETSQNYEKFYWDATPGEWALCVHREKSKEASDYEVEFVSEVDFSVSEIPLPNYSSLNKYEIEVTLGPGKAIGNADGISPFRADMTPLHQWRIANPVPQFIYGIVERRGPDIPLYIYMQKCNGLKSKCSYLDVPDHFYKMKCNSRSEAFKFDVGQIEGPWSLVITRTKKHHSHTRVRLKLFSEHPLRITEIDEGYEEEEKKQDDDFMQDNAIDVDVPALQAEYEQRKRMYDKWAEEDEIWQKDHDMKVKAASKPIDYSVKGEGVITKSGIIEGAQYVFYDYVTGPVNVEVTNDSGSDISVFLAQTSGIERADSFIENAKIDINPKETKGQLKYEVTDNTMPYVLGFMRNSGKDDAKFTYTITAPNKIDLCDAEEFESIPSKEIEGELDEKSNDRSPYGSGSSLSALKQWQLTIKEPGKVYFALEHDGSTHRIALQKTDRKISKFLSQIPDATFKAEEKRGVFAWEAIPGTWALCVYRDTQKSATKWNLSVSSHIDFDIEEIAELDQTDLKEDDFDACVMSTIPIFRNDLRCIPQWNIAIPGNQDIIVKIKREGGAKSDVIFFMQNRNGKKIKASLKGVQEEIHVLTNKSDEETFSLRAEEPAVWTCVLTRTGQSESKGSNVKVTFLSQRGVLISEFEDEKYTEEMKERDQEFINMED